jgi:glycine amidinotransferase|tara:strand:+ start:1448 stop:2464 length:1017 start_codon:yes stop_codon:yes gene_type:complete
MIEVHNTFDPLKEIIIGDIDVNAVKLDDEREQKRVEYIFNKTKDELTNFQEIISSMGIKVHRPKPIPNKEIKTPYWSMPGTKIPLTPRDLYLILGDTIIESAMCEQERFFETFYFRDIMIEQFKQGAKWMAMPIPRHDYDDYKFVDDNDVPNQDPIMDAPSCMKYGKDIFVNTKGAGNQLGYSWIEKMFGDTYNLHEIKNEKIVGHLDSQLAILRPGLLLTFHERKDLPEFFQEWDIIGIDPTRDRNMSTGQTLVDSRIQDSDFANTVLAVNCLSIDRNTVVMWEHYKHETEMLKQLEKKNIEVIFVPFTYSHFFNQGVTCLTLELKRETLEGLVSYQ